MVDFALFAANKALEKKVSEGEELKTRLEEELKEKIKKMEKELENATVKAAGKHCCKNTHTSYLCLSSWSLLLWECLWKTHNSFIYMCMLHLVFQACLLWLKNSWMPCALQQPPLQRLLNLAWSSLMWVHRILPRCQWELDTTSESNKTPLGCGRRAIWYYEYPEKVP